MCPRSSDQFYVVTNTLGNGSILLGHIVDPVSIFFNVFGLSDLDLGVQIGFHPSGEITRSGSMLLQKPDPTTIIPDTHSS